MKFLSLFLVNHLANATTTENPAKYVKSYMTAPSQIFEFVDNNMVEDECDRELFMGIIVDYIEILHLIIQKYYFKGSFTNLNGTTDIYKKDYDGEIAHIQENMLLELFRLATKDNALKITEKWLWTIVNRLKNDINTIQDYQCGVDEDINPIAKLFLDVKKAFGSLLVLMPKDHGFYIETIDKLTKIEKFVNEVKLKSLNAELRAING